MPDASQCAATLPSDELWRWECEELSARPGLPLAAHPGKAVAAACQDAGCSQLHQANPALAHFPIDLLEPDGERELPAGASYVKDEEHLWSYGCIPEVTAEQMGRLKALLVQRKGSFAYSLGDLPGYTGPSAEFIMKPGARAFCKARQYSPLEEQIRDEKLTEQHDVGFILERDTRSDFAACPTMPGKKDADGNWTDRRLCQDYRWVNQQMVADHKPLPLPDSIFRSLKGSKVLSKIDMRSGFMQIPIHPDSQHVTAFWWGSKLFQYTRLPFGIKTSVAIFQRVMETELEKAGLTHCAKVFVDDILIHSNNMEEHLLHLAAVIDALHAVGLRIHPAKSVFATNRIEYLGHMVTPDGLEPVAAKVAAMAQLPVPKNKDDLRSALGLINYYRCYIPDASSIAQPLNELLRKDVPFDWGPEQQQAYDALKAELCVPGKVLRHAHPDRPLILHTDWSTHGIAAVLGQLDDHGNEYMVACISRSLNKHERQYEAWKGELLAAVWGVKSFRIYLHGPREFELVTDHRPLLWLLTAPNPTGQQARWVLALQEYSFTIRHRPGATNIAADVPSRFPLPTTADITGARLDKESDDPYNGPLPKVVFGPVGTGVPLQPYRLEEAPPALLPAANGVPATAAVSQPASAALFRPGQVSGCPAGSLHVSACLPACNSNPAADAAEFRPGLGPAAGSSASCHAMPCNTTTTTPMGDCQLPAEPALAVAALARVATFTAARHRQYTYHLHGVPDCLGEYTCDALDPWEYAASCWPAPPEAGAPIDRVKQEVLRRLATRWVQEAGEACVGASCTSGGQAGQFLGSPDAVGVRETAALSTASVSSTFHTAASAGIVLCELFGGLCAGLEMALRNGLRIHTYIYVDKDPVCRDIAQHRIHQLMAQYPHLLPATAVASAFDLFTQNVWLITSSHLAALAARLPQQWLVVGGWECQDLSPAGTCTGLEGDHSNTFFPMLQVIGALQQLQQRLPPAYLIENTAFQYNWKSVVVRETHFKHVCTALGTPVCIDAAQFNSYAHRLRNYWTNLCDIELLTAAVSQVRRRPGLQVQHILQPGRQAGAAIRDDQPPRYPCNQQGQPLSALPTIVAYPQSHAFRPGQPGAVWDSSTEQWTEPTADECELAMGYQQGTTAAPGVSEQQRRAVMGRCMDANVMQALCAISAAWFRQQHWAKGGVQYSIAVNTCLPEPAAAACSPQGVAGCLTWGRSTHDVLCSSLQQVILASTAEIQDPAAAESQDPSDKGGRGVLDVWEDAQLLHFLRQQQYMPGTSHAERTRVRKRAAIYVLAMDGRLFRVMPDGSRREVPKKESREQLIAEYHEKCGHYGVRRTAALIQNSYWWHGIWSDVALAVSKCKLCGRVRSSFSAQQPTLSPLPISGMFYRFGCDLAGPFPKTKAGSVYVMVVIEYYSKFLHVIPLPDKRASTTAAAFAQHILARYGSMAELVTDAGTEWSEEFAELLAQALIDHRRTSAGHPQADGLAERAVQTVKRALRKLSAQQGHKDDWDLHLPMLVLGYNCSPQKSTGLAPYMMMYARTPIIPPAIRERMLVPFDLDDDPVKDFMARKKLVQQHYIVAGDNLRIAQQRDKLRYAYTRSGAYLPRLRRFEPGDFVYVSTNAKTTLDIKARPLILRVKEVRPSGVLIVEGRCGSAVSVHATKCAPCHLPDIDPRIDPTLVPPSEDTQCEVCHQSDDEAYMLPCDSCNRARHLYCAEPPMEVVPAGIWLCPDCMRDGKTAEQVEQQRAQDRALEMQQQRADDLTPAEKKAKQLHGRLVQKTFFDEHTKLPRPFWGRLSFVGPGAGDNLLVTYEDGDTETCTMGKMWGKKIKLMPANTQLPSDVCIPDSAAAVVAKCISLSGSSTLSLPSSWDLQSPQEVARALSLLLPGEYATAHFTRIANSIKALAQKGEKGGWVPTTAAELQPLARLVDFSGCQSFMDPFAGSGAIAAFFAAMGFSVLQNDWDERWSQVQLRSDALQPAFYRAHPAQVIVTSPPFAVLDIAAPLVAAAAAVLACIHVPGHWFASATRPRQQWLHDLQQQGRLHILMGLERGPLGRKCAFLLVFATADMKRQMLRTADSSDMLTFVQAS